MFPPERKKQNVCVKNSMKRNLILSSLLLALAACETAKRTPYLGGVGEYGYTYDLNNSPSPFVDTSYRPLTVRDLSGPIMVTATGRVAVAILEQQAAEGKTNASEIISTPGQAATNALPLPKPPAENP